MSAELIAFVESLNCCWIERRFDDLADYLAPDIVMVAPGGAARFEGLAAAIESYRAFMARAEIAHFEARDFVLTERGITAVAEYRWDMTWADSGTAYQASGREVFVLSRLGSGWRVVWRTSLPTMRAAPERRSPNRSHAPKQARCATILRACRLHLTRCSSAPNRQTSVQDRRRMNDVQDETLLTLTADIVVAHV